MASQSTNSPHWSLASLFLSRVSREPIVFVRVVAGSAVCIGAAGALRGGMYHDNSMIGIEGFLENYIYFCMSRGGESLNSWSSLKLKTIVFPNLIFLLSTQGHLPPSLAGKHPAIDL